MKLRITPLPGKTLVALSGGADSVALLRLLTSERSSDVEALHCNFHLRGAESDRDQTFCQELCDKLSVPLHIRHFDTLAYAKEHGVGIEMAARELRYQWFGEMRLQLGAQQIAVAHHRDDQAETLLLNLIRGTGLRGLAGMQERRDFIVRPLLGYSKAELLTYLEHLGQDYVTDSTNLERDTLRNRLRLDVLPLLQELNPQATLHLAQTAERVAEALPYYLRGIDASDQLTPAVLHERLHGLGFTPTQESDILHSTRSGAVFESPTHRLLRHQGRLVIEPKDQPTAPPRLTVTSKDLESHEVLQTLETLKNLSPTTCLLDADHVSLPLTLRHPCRGDRFQPLGMRGTRLVSDFLTDRHLTLFDKQRQWLVCDATGHIVWVVGLRPDHRFRVTEKTKHLLIISL